jgi:oligopeptidase B
MQKPPIAPRKRFRQRFHGVTLEDPYHWLRDPAYPAVTDPEILSYLNAENAWFDAFMSPHRPLVDALFEEIKARREPTEESVPFPDGDWMYQWAFEAEAQYRIWRRWPKNQPDQTGIILNEPVLAAGREYFALGGLSVSPNGRYLAWAQDTDGSERYEVRIKDLFTGKLLGDLLTDTAGAPVWANDNATLFYRKLSEQWRPYQIIRHRLGTSADADVLIYEEADPSFFVSAGKTQSEAYIVFSTGDHVTSEQRFLPADRPEDEPQLIVPRRSGHEYDADHHGDWLYIHTNDRHKNFRLVRAPVTAPGEENWESVIDGSDHHYLRSAVCFRDFIAIEERIDGLDQIRIRHYDGDEHYVQFPESAYEVGLGVNMEYAARELRIGYDSMVTPQTVYDYNLAQRKLSVRKVQQIPSGYDPSHYATERLMAPVRDGQQVPVSIVCRRDLVGHGPAPLYLYGYGAYGQAVAPGFSTSRLSLLDRGFVYAIAHLRGGDDLGYAWYEAGKQFARWNTFNDFVDVARHLIDTRRTSAGQIAISGGSAGGELIGVALNEAAELWGVAVAHVPFVDVLNTMLDASLPLTPLEWPEWGNPIQDPEAFAYIRSYSPYDQVRPQSYPPLLVTVGLNDPRVTYWEGAKFVARLRHAKTDDNPLLLKTNMGAGHGGRSGRFDALYEAAEEFAFVLIALSKEKDRPGPDRP